MESLVEIRDKPTASMRAATKTQNRKNVVYSETARKAVVSF
jgi:hypothetical protein